MALAPTGLLDRFTRSFALYGIERSRVRSVLFSHFPYIEKIILCTNFINRTIAHALSRYTVEKLRGSETGSNKRNSMYRRTVEFSVLWEMYRVSRIECEIEYFEIGESSRGYSEKITSRPPGDSVGNAFTEFIVPPISRNDFDMEHLLSSSPPSLPLTVSPFQAFMLS